MTSRLFETIDSLEQRNKLLNNILNSLTHPFYVIDANDYTIKLANPAARFGTLTEDMTCYALTHHRNEPCKNGEHPCVIEHIKQTGEPVSVEHIHYDEEGNPRINEIHGYPIVDSKGNIIQVIEYNLDITDRKMIEEELQVSEQTNRTITTTAKDAIIMMDDKGVTSFWNPAAEDIFGYTKEEAIGNELHVLISPERYREDYGKGMEEFKDSGKGAAVGKILELTAKKKDDTEFPAELSLSAIQLKGRWNAIGIVRDITERKQAENRILESLEEKELLLREIHHRVKNNMQVISSLLDLQLGYLSDKQPHELFNESKNRIKSMALVHEKLYRSKDLAKINFSDYISTLINNLYMFYGVDIDRVALKLDMEEITLGIDTAIPCGLIINELATNSLKYAFPDNRDGEIKIALHMTGERHKDDRGYVLTVGDNGIGLPENLDLKEIKTLGLHLVTTIVEHQLQGTYELHRTNGTEFHIRFKEIKYGKRI
jgi:PAS domain S-box-containing protein